MFSKLNALLLTFTHILTNNCVAGAGFIVHPTLSPNNTSGISVFHQLHCLNQLRAGYYSSNRTLTVEEDDSAHPHGPAHTRHCFDYLRQSIMCAADSNLEPVVPELGGITGWGNTRMCRDFGQLAEWATRWKAGQEQGAGLGV